MLSNTKGEILNLPYITSKYKTAQVCPENKNAILISLSKLCDNKHKIVVFKENKPIMRAARCNKTGTYLVNLSNPL